MNIKSKRYFFLGTTILLIIGLNSHQKAITTESQQKSLTGTWTLESDVFHANEKESTGCLAGSGGDGSLPEYPEFKVDQDGNNLKIEGSFGAWASNKGNSGLGSAQTGKVSGNEVTLTATAGSFTFEYKGKVNEKGDKVTGTITCKHPSGSAIATGNFTWNRDKETVFHYFYINGLNTAAGIPGLEQEGTCEGERIMVQRLLNELKEPGKLEAPTCNPSGRTPNRGLQAIALAAQTNLSSPSNITMPAHARGATSLLARDLFNCIRAGNIPSNFNVMDPKTYLEPGGVMAPGDIREAYKQAKIVETKLRVWGGGTYYSRESGTTYSMSDPLVSDIVNKINKTVEEEKTAKDNKEHHFIIIAHSQGNFFAESVAERLKSMPNPANSKEKLLSRFGVLALASPTNYPDTPELLVMGFTRENDAILELNKIHPEVIQIENELPGESLSLIRELIVTTKIKIPMPPTLPPLGKSEPLIKDKIISGDFWDGLLRVLVTLGSSVRCFFNSSTSGPPSSNLLAHLLPNYLGYNGANFPTAGSPSEPFTPLVFKDILNGLEILKQGVSGDETAKSTIKNWPRFTTSMKQLEEQPKSEPTLPLNPNKLPEQYIRENSEPLPPPQVKTPVEQPKSEPILPQNPDRLPDEFIRDSTDQPSPVPPYPQDPGPNKIRDDFR